MLSGGEDGKSIMVGLDSFGNSSIFHAVKMPTQLAPPVDGDPLLSNDSLLIAMLLIEAGESINYVHSNTGCSPLHWAAYRGDVEMTENS